MACATRELRSEPDADETDARTSMHRVAVANCSSMLRIYPRWLDHATAGERSFGLQEGRMLRHDRSISLK
jgi:hypothetical protein